MAKLAQSQGQDWYKYDDNRLALLVERVEAGKADPSYFAERAHAQQEMRGGHGKAAQQRDSRD